MRENELRTNMAANSSNGVPEPPPRLPPRPKVIRRRSELQMIPYYHTDIRGLEQVKEVLCPHIHIPGSFLLRNSTRNEGALVVSVVHEDGSIKHFTINENNSQYFLQDKYFHNIASLVKNYEKEDVPNLENVPHVRLLHPVTVSVREISSPTGIFSDSYPPPSSRSTLQYSKSFPRQGMKNGSKERILSDSSFPMSTSTLHGYRGAATMATSGKVRNSEMNKSYKGGYLEKNGDEERETRPVTYRRGSVDDQRNNSVSSKSPRHRKMSIDERPPAVPPLPPEDNAYLDSQSSQTYIYSRAVDTKMNRFDDLLQKLKFADEHQKCDCGIYIKDSEFPGGWTIHRSTEENTKGMVFFINDEKTVSSWTLPQDIVTRLEPSHMATLKSLGFNFDHFGGNIC